MGVTAKTADADSLAELKARLTALEVGREADQLLYEERDKRYEQRATSQDTAVANALRASEVAQGKADTALEKRLDSLNEFRQMSSDWAKDFARSDVLNGIIKAQEDRIQGLADLVHQQISRGNGMQQAWGYLVGAGGLIFALLEAFIHR